jgi:hypothetical protein
MSNEFIQQPSTLFEIYFNIILLSMGGGGAWWHRLRHHATNQLVTGSIPDGVIGIFQ